MADSKPAWQFEVEPRSDASLHLVLGGSWRLRDALPSTTGLEAQLPGVRRLSFSGAGITAWDTGLLTWLARLVRLCREQGIETDTAELPEGVRRLLELAFAVPEKKDAARSGDQPSFLANLGNIALDMWRAAPAMLNFFGEILLSFGRFFRGKAQYRKSDLFLIIQDVGPNAVLIVSLISFLVGMILAYMGAVQLEMFGAQIYIADLVGIGMVRVIGALMTGILLAGRTGAAFAAQLGTMQVNEEIDAFRTLGISSMDFLVLPRMLALLLMAPLLTLYAGIMGVLAGMIVAVGVFNVGAFEYYHETLRALDISQFVIGMVYGTIFGFLVAFAGCLRGIQCGRSAQAVGQAATSAVVTGILFIVIAASLLTILLQKLGV